MVRRRGPTPTPVYWRERVRSLTENDGLSARAIVPILLHEARHTGRDDAPQERTVYRLRAEFLEQSEADRRLYREVSWPESFDQGALPWESAGAVLPLIQESLEKGFARPQVRFARWFWRITQAAPDTSISLRRSLAGQLARAELGLTDVASAYRAVESALLGREVRGDEVIEGDFDGLFATLDLLIQSNPDRWAPRQGTDNATD
jgi:hypothetical protein